ncbi:hypothetical protein P280DRAFT_466933 [Massarina eburnea CBS 473.64]|uniref:HAD-like protein n=1 Tax=Massarina eburnea CBS 473.64 TaxID=1395130 RepID=A0A6A6SD02_9PLEO|nr:hypothetical protein P280DRAFT_466933 [Massarina eburnea CBS 473.64]
MAPMLSTAGPIHWILDFDGTITKRDTLNTLVNISAQNRPDSNVLAEWKRVSQAYMDDYKATMQNALPKDTHRPSTIASEKLILGITEEVERRSLDRVSESRLFAGLTGTILYEGARRAVETGEVQLRDGFQDFFRHVQDKQHAFHILSVNWSQRFIAACLHASGTVLPQKLSSVYSNELDGTEESMPSSGAIVPSSGNDSLIVSSRNKLSVLSHLREHEQTPIVYIGDSWTDFECLLAADLGICIRDDPMTSTQRTLAESLERVGVKCAHLEEINRIDHSAVFWTRDFHEVSAWLESPALAK